MGELGDCFLLHFKEGTDESHVLIDCGSFRNRQTSKDRIALIVNDIKKTLKGKKLDVVVGTHQHNDHLSGFTHCEALFQNAVKQVWLSWLDDPKDAFARKIQRDRLGLVQQLKGIYNNMTKLGIQDDHEVVNDVLGFLGVSGDAPEVPMLGLEALRIMGEKPPEYLSPGTITGLPGMNKESVKVYVLGPPRNQKLLFDATPGKEETYDPHLALAETSASKIKTALENQITGEYHWEEAQFPFNLFYKQKPVKSNKAIKAIKDIYDHPDDEYRKIDNEWLASADRLALYLDSYTNNSSLVLAFELVKTGKVLLFAGDAQTGNWNSWEKLKWEDAKKDFKTFNLLRNTVLYKVGHHGSHNATLVKALEAMEHMELVAMIPVDKTDPNITKKNGWKMPARNLYKRLKEKTSHRILLMDDGFADGCDPQKDKAKAKWNGVKHTPKIKKTDLYVEYVLEG
jgi:hypothetical protein